MKNIPHFVLLSFICAELCVRLGYDSIYMCIKKKRSLWSSANIESDDFVFAKCYVTKLFRSNLRSTRLINTDRLDHFQSGLERKRNFSCLKTCFPSISVENDHFRLTTIATCTYTVATLFLYYFACTLLFLYITKATDYTIFIRSLLETIFNVGKRIFSLEN